jgi:alpha-mannosidase
MVVLTDDAVTLKMPVIEPTLLESNMRSLTHRLAIACILAASVLLPLPTRAEDAFKPVENGPIDLSKQKTLYVVGYAHLDTQWCWCYPQTIREFLHNTLQDNFRLIEKYPNYVFNFSGSRRYQMMKEYYPEDYEQLKKYVAAGRWFPAGSSVDEEDSNVPCTESLIRHCLYGNEFFRHEFDKASEEFMLPDCFGFQAGLPSVLAHCGIRGFSTQKLTWGSANGIPFKVGVWEGPDGQSVIAAFDPGAYTGNVGNDLSQDNGWKSRIENTGKLSGIFADYHYFGTGDRGGAPGAGSVAWVERSIAGNGPVHVVEGPADRMFKEITDDQKSHLPRYKGDLLLTKHSAGSVTSQAYMKRWNRKNELLADAAERASVAAKWMGGEAYPTKKLYDAWMLLLGSQMHDMLPGTSIPRAYEFCWNDEILAANQFAAVEQDAAGAIISGMDTTAHGISVVVYNPLATEREDAVEATVTFPAAAPDAVQVLDPQGHAVPAQVLSRDGNNATILFLAKAPSVGFVTYDVQPASAADQKTALSATATTLENADFRVTLNAAGDIASIFDKRNNKEILSAPARLSFQHENPAEYPSWNMDWEDRKLPPRAYVDGPATVRIVESGPARVALEVERHAQGSKFVQQIRLAAGDAGERIEFATNIDWQTHESSLKAAFPLTVSNPMATYDMQLGTTQRGNNEPKKYEVPQHQWFDLTATDNTYGVAVLNDCKFGSDKPDDQTVRLTLLYTPGVRGGFQHEATQDFGRHQMLYALAPHAGDWRAAGTPWQAARLNQPMIAFQTNSHAGNLGRSFSLLQVNNAQVAATAIKKAEEGDEIIVRLKELTGNPAKDVKVTMPSAIASAREVDGQERNIGPATVRDGALVVDMPSYRLRAFALKLGTPPASLATAQTQSVEMPYDLDAVSFPRNRADGAFDAEGRTLPGDQLPATITSEGIDFKMGPTADGQNNALACRGQTIKLPAGFDHVYLIAAASNGDTKGTFTIGTQQIEHTIEDWSGFVGQWDYRLWKGKVPELTYQWSNPVAGLVPGYAKRDTVAWFCSHRHHPKNGNEPYQYSYLFKYGFDLAPGATSITLPDNEQIRIFAITAARNPHDNSPATRPLYDTLDDHTGNGPAIEPAGGTFHDSTMVTLNHPLYWREGGLHYTTDGTVPTAASPTYTRPFPLGTSSTVKACLVDATGKADAISTATFDINDTTPPTIKSVAAVGLQSQIRITFSEPVAKAAAENPANYQLQPAIAVSSAALADDGTGVTLTLAQQLALGSSYQLTVHGVTDAAPTANPIQPATVSLAAIEPVYTLDAFTCAGKGKEIHVARLPVKSGDAWTINLFVKPKVQPDDRTVIAGFGQGHDDIVGAGRFISKFSNGLHFWARNCDVNTTTPLDVGKWQMLTATYDGTTVTLYKNGQPIGQEPLSLADDEPTVRIAPLDPWEGQRRFTGEIHKLTIWPTALSPETLKSLWDRTKQ